VDFAGVERYIDTPVKRYSSGMYVRLAFAVAAFLEPEILIVDEVLAVGDAEFQKKCLGRMKNVSVNDGRTVLFVSHQLNSIRSLCENCIYLKNGILSKIGPTYQVIDSYMQEGKSGKNIKFYDEYLKYVKIEQQGSIIAIEAEYDNETCLDIPHLGYVIYNSGNQPIFGSNPTLDLVEKDFSGTKRGKISVQIEHPKLIDGEYTASIWFGNGKEDFIEDVECLKFVVSSMSEKKQDPHLISGNVVPHTCWKFEVYE